MFQSKYSQGPNTNPERKEMRGECFWGCLTVFGVGALIVTMPWLIIVFIIAFFILRAIFGNSK
jgi:hypothetical protein